MGGVTSSEDDSCCAKCASSKDEEEYTVDALEEVSDQIEERMRRLFHLQNLKGTGMLEEQELVRLNEKIAMLHYGKTTDKQVVRDKYKHIFRSKLDPDGKPVPYDRFRIYMLEVIEELDPDPLSQEMILGQLIQEAQIARQAFYQASFQSMSDLPYMPQLSVSSWTALNEVNGTIYQVLPKESKLKTVNEVNGTIYQVLPKESKLKTVRSVTNSTLVGEDSSIYYPLGTSKRFT